MFRLHFKMQKLQYAHKNRVMINSHMFTDQMFGNRETEEEMMIKRRCS